VSARRESSVSTAPWAAMHRVDDAGLTPTALPANAPTVATRAATPNAAATATGHARARPARAGLAARSPASLASVVPLAAANGGAPWRLTWRRPADRGRDCLRHRAVGRDGDRLAVVAELERHSVEKGVGRVRLRRLDTEPASAKDEVEREPLELGRQARREAELAAVVAQPAETRRRPRSGLRPGRRCGGRRACSARGRKGRSAPPRRSSRTPT
jgi:hypothetical protein